MTDALAFTIDLPDGKYASVNRTTRGWTDPRKSEIYRYVYGAVLEAAQREIARTGWTKAECECFATIMRVMPAHWRADAMNLGKPEWDALTEAGVWTDDRLANPCLPWIRYDDEGPHRVTIVVMKLYEPANVRIVARAMEARQGRDAKRLDGEATTARSRRDAPKSGNKITENPEVAKMRNSATPERQRYTGGDIPHDKALIDGYLVPREEALRMISAKRSA